MTNKDLIAKLQQLPPDLGVRVVVSTPEYIEEEVNLWVYHVEHSNTGDSGYEVEGEIRLLTSE